MFGEGNKTIGTPVIFQIKMRAVFCVAGFCSKKKQ
jgi:hypothetical protein